VPAITGALPPRVRPHLAPALRQRPRPLRAMNRRRRRPRGPGTRNPVLRHLDRRRRPTRSRDA
jgi:hypothetical protein